MDIRLALGSVLAIPVFYALNLWLTTTLPPLTGAGVALVAYWAALAAALLAWSDRDALRDLLVAVSPGRLITVTLALPAILLGAMALRLLGEVTLPPHILIAAALAAMVHALLEELFWRGALIPRATARAAAVALGLYWLFHLSWLGLQGIGTAFSPPIRFMAPVALGGVWTAARLASGTLGAGILSHAAFALFLFVAVAAWNWPTA